MKDKKITMVKEIYMENTTDGHNKFWDAELYDDGTVITRWGKIDKNEQSKVFPNEGEEFFEKKIEEKIKKSYVEVKD